jgi:polyol permease family
MTEALRLPVEVHTEEAEEEKPASLLDRIGIPRPLFWGFVGCLLFMIGDGVESGFLSPYMQSQGISAQQVALMFTVYGFVIAVASWLSGALSDLWGPRQVMWIGLITWVGFEVIFLTLGLKAFNWPVMLVSYGLRGLGYPLFAFGFLVWIAAATPPQRLSSAAGWFWFAFTGGFPTLGSLFASFLIPDLGQYNTFWASVVLVAVGGLIALLLVREPTGMKPLAAVGESPVTTLGRAITILWRQPRIGAGAVVRTINTAAELGFLVFMPTFFVKTIGLPLTQWLQLLSLIFFSNIIWNLLWGVLGDRIGWQRTVAWFGGVGCAITTLLLYYVPLAVGPRFSIIALVGMLYGATLAAYVPLSALMPSMAPEHKGAAMSALNLGAGASTFVGPAIVGIFLGSLGVVGVMYIYAALYLFSAILTLAFVRAPEGVVPQKRSWGELGFGAASTLLGHPPAVPNLDKDDDIDMVMVDVGGGVYDDDAFAQALLRAAKELAGGELDEREFWKIYDAQRGSGRLRAGIAQRFVPGADVNRLTELTRKYWEYPASALYPDVRPTLAVLASKYKLCLICDTQKDPVEALTRDGIAEFFTVVARPDEVGAEKPDPKIFRWAMAKAGVSPDNTVLVANRLDTDIRPARRIGIRTIWLLRGEAPPAPTIEQLGEPDAVITSMTGLPIALVRVARTREAASAVSPDRVPVPAY